MYPRIVFDCQKFEHNLKVIEGKLRNHGMSYVTVCKVYCALPEIAKIAEPYVDYFGDSRLDNLIKLQHLNKPKMLIRIPMLSETAKVVQYADVSCNSELVVVKKLNEEAEKQQKMHQIILMKDVGDLREGYFYDDTLFKDVEEMMTFKHIEIIGLGVNLACYGAINPTAKNLQQLVDVAAALRERFGLKLELVSGGASTSVYLLDNGEMPKGITNLRIGDFAITGNEYIFDHDYADMFQDVAVFEGEIVELKEKPSVPIGENGRDAFRGRPVFEDRGVRKRAIIAAGRQDIDHTDLTPHNDQLTVLGASSDHLILDVHDSDPPLAVGDVLAFRMGYSSILRAFTSEYVTKVIVK